MISILDLKRRLLAFPGYRKGDAASNEGMNRAAEAQVALSREALDWFKEEYANTADDRADATRRQNEISDEQLESMRTQNRIANDYDQYNRTTFRPLEQRIVQEAQNYDTPERRDQAAAEARAGVQMAADRSQDALTRSLRRSGVNPSSMQSVTMRQMAGLETAKATAGAETTARRNVETMGAARMADAANMGRGLPSAQTAALQTGTAAGMASSGAAGQALGSSQSGAGLMATGFGQAGQFSNNAGGIYGQIGRNAAMADSSQAQTTGAALGALGTVAGALIMSDEDKKEGTGKKADTARMLAEVEGTQVDEGWTYNPAAGAPDDGGVPHDGPMAQEVKRTMGEEVAPGGTVIDMASMNGKLMGAVQEISKVQKRTDKRLARLEERMAA